MKIFDFLKGSDGQFSSSRLTSIILLIQYLYETRLVLRVDPTQYIMFSITFISLIGILVLKMSAENITAIINSIKGKE